MTVQSRWMSQVDPDSAVRKYAHGIDPQKIAWKQSLDKILTLLNVFIGIAQEEDRFYRGG